MTIERRALEWFVSGDKGASSETIARHMMGMKHERPFGVSEPSDDGDLGRCLRLLQKIPEWKPRMGELAKLSHAWAALVPAWEELEALMIKETGPNFDRNKSAPKTYKLIRDLTGEARKADGWVTIGRGASVRMKI